MTAFYLALTIWGAIWSTLIGKTIKETEEPDSVFEKLCIVWMLWVSSLAVIIGVCGLIAGRIG